MSSTLLLSRRVGRRLHQDNHSLSACRQRALAAGFMPFRKRSWLPLCCGIGLVIVFVLWDSFLALSPMLRHPPQPDPSPLNFAFQYQLPVVSKLTQVGYIFARHLRRISLIMGLSTISKWSGNTDASGFSRKISDTRRLVLGSFRATTISSNRFPEVQSVRADPSP
jgi:hypothetical protein